ncbi:MULTISPECIES: copper homeostasis periplasmic binding protein CopC [unclassified Mesorhizobium]|uniref:copper homeostasis periplasmic binding protein CopC n=1 Tax=unclassified Mesorhizobium TaxID=325217 RepID=UPI001FED636B|nr:MULTISPECIES: copper homeostasis periplasmic binding protein CopC [unclassified Mesorhizobium]
MKHTKQRHDGSFGGLKSTIVVWGAGRRLKEMFMPKYIRALILATLIGGMFADEAFAHARLTSAIPAEGSIVAIPPNELDLTFSEDVDLKFTGVLLVGADKRAVATGPASFGGGNAASLVVPISRALDAGTYTVDWHALSADGHKAKGRYSFIVKP